MKSLAAGVVFALLIQYPIALTFVLAPVIYRSESLIDGLGFIAFYFFWVTMIALVIIVVFGVPIFYLMHACKQASTRNTVIAGGLIALVLTTVLTWPLSLEGGFSAGETYYGTYRKMIVDGIPTFWGWLSFAEDLVMFVAHGALGAAAFRFGWKRYQRPDDQGETIL